MNKKLLESGKILMLLAIVLTFTLSGCNSGTKQGDKNGEAEEEFVSAFDEGQLKRELDIPDNVRPQSIISFGYADEKVPIPSKFRLDDITYFEKFGNRHTEKGLFPISQHVEPVTAAIEKLKKGRVLDRLKKKIKKK